MENIECVVFLDRDGTVSREKGIINHPLRLELEPTAGKAISCLNKSNIPVFILTNQPGVARGFISPEIVKSTNERMEALLAEEDARVDGIFVCPHLPGSEDGECDCHKPQPGLARKALEESGLNPKRIYVVGDRQTDIELAHNLGGVGVLVKTGYGLGEWDFHSECFVCAPSFIAENVGEAVRWIILEERKSGREILPVPQYDWPDIDDQTESAVIKQLYSSISIGDNHGIIGELERGWAQISGRKYAVSFCTGTMALYAGYRALGIRRNDEVIVPAYGFFATASPLITIGAIPVFVDTDEYGNIDPDQIEKSITKKTRAIVVSHIFGIPADLKRIQKIAQKAHLQIIEDASHALGSENEGIKAGSVGDVAIFSLQAKKMCPAGEGGVLVTDDLEVLRKATLEGHFKQKNLQILPKDHPLYDYHETGAGLKLRIHPLAASIGVVSLQKFDKNLKNRRQCMLKMEEILRSCKFLKLAGSLDELSGYNFPVLLDSCLVPFKEKLMKDLRSKGFTHFFKDNLVGLIPEKGIFTNPRVFFPDYPDDLKRDLKEPNKWPNARIVEDSIFLLPLWDQEIDLPIALEYARALVETIETIAGENDLGK